MRLGKILICIVIAALVWNFISDSGTTVNGEQIRLGAMEKVRRFIYLPATVEANVSAKKSKYVPLTDIPLGLQQALIATEDTRFYRHHGVDLEGVARALFTNFQDGQYSEGGSTITQQLVKNLFLTQNKTMGRKIEEVVIAVGVELRYSKDEILEMYLNQIYYGSGAYGINAAADIYFHKQAKDLNLAESALLAGLPQAPSAYSPYVNFTAAKERQAIVLDLMAKQGFISPGMAEKAKKEPLNLAEQGY